VIMRRQTISLKALEAVQLGHTKSPERNQLGDTFIKYGTIRPRRRRKWLKGIRARYNMKTEKVVTRDAINFLGTKGNNGARGHRQSRRGKFALD